MRYVILGGGVAGVACLEELLRAAPSADVTLVCAAPSVKAVANYLKTSDVLERFDLEELPLDALAAARPSVKPLRGVATAVDAVARRVTLADGRVLPYDRLCVAAGAVPRSVVEHPLVVALRDLQSMEGLAQRLAGAARVVVVGNGGIALGLVHELRGRCAVVWAVRDGYVGSTFLDASASAFFLAEHAAQMAAVPAAAAPPDAQPPPPGAAPSQSAAYHEACGCGVGHAGGGGPEPDAARSFNYHDDRPHAAMLAAAARGAGGDDDSDGDDDGGGGGRTRQVLPTYAPLPQRTRRRHAQPGALAAGGAAGPPSDGRSSSTAAPDDTAHPAFCEAPAPTAADAAADHDMTSPPPPPPPQPPSSSSSAYGSSLGPGWVTALQRLLPAGHVAAGSSGAGELARGASSSGSSAGSSSPPLTPPTTLIETGCELAALRGSGAAGAVGVLADGRWHSVHELSAWPSAGPRRAAASAPAAAAPAAAATTDACACSCPPSEPSTPCRFPLHVRLSNGREYGCDFVVSATGVLPVGAAAAAAGGSATAATAAAAAERGDLLLLPAGAFARSPADGGLIVNRCMQTTGSPDVFAAGDAASVMWPQRLVRRAPDGALPLDDPAVRVPLWFQMRLWNQARQQGILAARWMCGSVDPLEAEDGGLAFELFAHATRLLGFPVTLLGLFNGQGLGDAYEHALRAQVVVSAAGLEQQQQQPVGDAAGAAPGDAAAAGRARLGGAGRRWRQQQPAGAAPAATVLSATALPSAAAAPTAAATATGQPAVSVQLRVTPGVEYVKLVLLHGRIVGALLIGDTGLAETMENLILNRIPVTGATGGGGSSGSSGSGPQLLDLLHPDVDIEDYFD